MAREAEGGVGRNDGSRATDADWCREHPYEAMAEIAGRLASSRSFKTDRYECDTFIYYCDAEAGPSLDSIYDSGNQAQERFLKLYDDLKMIYKNAIQQL